MSPTTKSTDAAKAAPDAATTALTRSAAASSAAALDKLPIKMLHDRVLVRADGAEGERRSSGGILIPATAQVSHRLAWAQVVAVGQNVRTVEAGDRVLYDPDERAEVEVRGVEYVLLRERDIHAVAAERLGDTDGATGLYL
ncbi:MAG TPA: co-chaperone GroES [Actinocrinis sp.]|nr:co-chaperone GroES [Actinocrinis sp.]HEV3169848.1 co-chaperone GroES [Actinocrinis sp.]